MKSLTEHWSVGGTAALGTSTFENYDLRSRLAPGIEFNVFPYRESTRRILTMFYSLGLRTANYSEETIFGKLSEELLDHQLEASIALRQPWGTASGSFEVLHYLNRADKYRVEGFGEIDVRLFKGFSLELFARGSRRRDQLSLRRGWQRSKKSSSVSASWPPVTNMKSVSASATRSDPSSTTWSTRVSETSALSEVLEPPRLRCLVLGTTQVWPDDGG